MTDLDAPLLTIAQAAEYLNVPVSWLRDRVTARAVPHRRLGKHVRFSADDIDQILQDASQQPVHRAASPRPFHSRYRP